MLSSSLIRQIDEAQHFAFLNHFDFGFGNSDFGLVLSISLCVFLSNSFLCENFPDKNQFSKCVSQSEIRIPKSRIDLNSPGILVIFLN